MFVGPTRAEPRLQPKQSVTILWDPARELAGGGQWLPRHHAGGINGWLSDPVFLGLATPGRTLCG